ncbi:MAG TPA: large conductance mechanosensitive channel protein MscL [Longimicrobiaceae bacterium]|nr:large conductance mechanosensitive channel protein MscL [Longimicrobiaceae bacterium]
MFGEFRTFIARGNVIDLAVGVVIGAAFATVAKSFVDDILMPPIGLLTGGVDFAELYWNLSGERYASLAQAREAGAPVVAYGLFLSNVVTFLIVAFAVFLLVQGYNRFREKEEATPGPAEKDCPFCHMHIPLAARRCPYCTAELAEVVAG